MDELLKVGAFGVGAAGTVMAFDAFAKHPDLGRLLWLLANGAVTVGAGLALQPSGNQVRARAARQH